MVILLDDKYFCVCLLIDGHLYPLLTFNLEWLPYLKKAVDEAVEMTKPTGQIVDYVNSLEKIDKVR